MEQPSPVKPTVKISKLHAERDESELTYGSEMNSHFLDLQKSSTMQQSHEAEVQQSPLYQFDPETTIKLQKRNDMLRVQLKQMNQQLNLVIQKQKSRTNLKPPLVQDLGKEELQKELENSQKQLQIYSKNLKQLQSRLELSLNGNRIQELETELQQKEEEIAKLVQEKKAYEKINRSQEKALSNHSVETSITISYMSELKNLRQRVRDLEDKEKQNEKASMKKHEYYLKLEEQFRNVNHQNGSENASPQAKNRSETVRNKDLTKKGNGASNPYFKTRANSKPVAGSLPPSHLEEKPKEYENALVVLKKAMMANEKKFKTEKEQLQNQIQMLNEKNKELMAKLKDKERENNILTSRMNEMKRSLKPNLSAQLEEQSPKKEGGKLESPKKEGGKLESPNIKKVGERKNEDQLEDKAIVKSKKQTVVGMNGMRMEEIGKATKNTQAFSDQELFKNKKDWHISGFTIWQNKKAISGLMAYYRDADGEIIQGNMHASLALNDKDKGQEVKFKEGDYLKSISGTFDKSETYIQSLTVITANGETHKVGTAGDRSKVFEFDINEYEFPVVIFGGLEIEYREDEVNGEKTEVGASLVKLGVLIKSNAVEEKIEPHEDNS